MNDKPKRDPLGQGYWYELTDAQQHLLGALTDNYQPLRSILDQVEKNGFEVGGQVTWEKLAIFQALEIDMKNRDNLYVRRGKRWQKLWDGFGLVITSREHSKQELDAEFDDILDSIKPSVKGSSS